MDKESSGNFKKVRKAVIPAAGYGTRFLPATKALPKEMLPIVDIPSLQYIVKEAVDSGINDIMIVTTRGKEAIENYFDKSFELETILEKEGKIEYLALVRNISKMANIVFVRQRDMKGSGYVLNYAKSFVGDEPFAVLFGDDVMYTNENQKPVTRQLVDAYEKTGKSILGVQTIEDEEIRKYGVVVPNGKTEGRYTPLKGIMEKPQGEIPSHLTSLGRFVFTPSIFKYIDKTPPAKNGEIYLTTALELQAQVEGAFAYEFEARRYDIGDKQSFLEACIEYALRDDELKDNFSQYLKKIVEKLK